MEARPKKQTVARSGFAPFSRSVAFGLEKHLLVGYGVTGMHVFTGINCTTKSLLISDCRLSYFTVRLMFVRDARYFTCFPTHSPWVVLHEGGREVYYFYRFHCQVFFTINFSLCQNTNCVSRLSLGGSLGELF